MSRSALGMPIVSFPVSSYDINTSISSQLSTQLDQETSNMLMDRMLVKKTSDGPGLSSKVGET